jgi:putative acetyltransferase
VDLMTSLRWVAADAPDALALAAVQQSELASQNPADHVPYALHDDFEFVVLDLAGVPAACGGLQPLSPGLAEIKRMYVVPDARGQGLSRLVLAAIEDRARDLGIRWLRLETALFFTAAVELYRSSGYAPIPAYGEYIGDPISYCMERQLS